MTPAGALSLHSLEDGVKISSSLGCLLVLAAKVKVKVKVNACLEKAVKNYFRCKPPVSMLV